MNRMLCLIAIAAVCVAMNLYAQVDNEDQLANKKIIDQINDQTVSLVKQYEALAKRMEVLIKRYDLYRAVKQKEITIVPYQTICQIGSEGGEYIEIEKHNVMKDSEKPKKFIGVKIKNIKIYTNGSTISKIVSTIIESYYYSGDSTEVIIEDPSPTTGGVDDIKFSERVGFREKHQGKVIFKGKLMKDIENTTAYQTKNNLLRLFLIPNIELFNSAILTIGEGYKLRGKDTDENLFEFLKKSTNY